MKRPGLLVLGLLLVAAGPAGLAAAEPSPAPVASPAVPATPATPTGSAAPATPAAPSAPAADASTTVPTEAAPTAHEPKASPRPVKPAVPALSLAVAAADTPQSGRYFEDIGSFAFSGSAANADGADPDDRGVEIWQRTAPDSWARVASATLDQDGRYAARLPVTDRGLQTFVSTRGGSPAAPDSVRSRAVNVTVADASVTMRTPPARVDSLQRPRITGFVTPARAGVAVELQVRPDRTEPYRTVATTRTAADGTYALPFGTGAGELRTYDVRTSYRAANRPRYETATAQPVTRIRVLNAVVTATTAAEVATTYRAGCPVGPSRLRTITLNFYGFDHRMHRGVIIVRSDLTGRIIHSFQDSLDAGFPIRRMDNPNVYGGSDPRQMAADNTSGFNCRKVVGNPYAQSPHSYGIAIDVNTVENPYRDARGKWWPENGTGYIDRTPLRTGMLGYRSRLTSTLRAEHYFWGGLWNPGRDYQHFQYTR